MILNILCALLLITGLFLLLGIRPSTVFAPLIRPFQRRYEKKKRILRITGKPKGKIANTIDSAKEMLAAANMTEKTTTYKWASVISACIGLLIGFALDNLLVALVLAGGLSCSPLIVIRIRTGDYLRSLHEKLESAMSTVTNSYISSGDLIDAVESSLHLIPAPVESIFRHFYTQTQLVNSDIVKALLQIRDRINNRYWHNWCDVLMQCQRDRQMRFALSGIVSRLGEMRRAQMETDTTIRKHLGDYITTVLIVLGAIPLMGTMMPDWYTMLTTTPIGKITLAVILAAILSTAIWVARLYRPLEGGDTK